MLLNPIKKEPRYSGNTFYGPLLLYDNGYFNYVKYSRTLIFY